MPGVAVGDICQATALNGQLADVSKGTQVGQCVAGNGEVTVFIWYIDTGIHDLTASDIAAQVWKH